MDSTKSTRSLKVQIGLAGVVSIIAQGLLILPAALNSYLPLSEWGIFAIGVVLFIISTIWTVTLIRALRTGWRGNAHFILNQAIIIIGILLLSSTSGSIGHLGGFILTSLITALTVYGIIANITSPTLTKSEENNTEEKKDVNLLDLVEKANLFKEQVEVTTQKLNTEKQRTKQLTFLIELSHQLNREMDEPVAAQIAVTTLEHAVNCTAVSLMMYEPDKHELITLASKESTANIIPAGYRQSEEKGIHGRVMRQKKTVIVNDVTVDADFEPINNENTRSMVVVPLISHGQIKGMLDVRSDKVQAFDNLDIAAVEGVASELTLAWEKSSYNQRLADLIQSGVSLTTLLDPQTAVQEIANLAHRILETRFVFVTLLDQEGNYSRTAHSGNAPKLLSSLNQNPSHEPLLQAALNAVRPFRVRDLRKYTKQNNLEIDDPALRSVLAIPIRLHRLSIGSVLAFGKREGIFFSESDEALAGLLGSQAAAAVESSWLYQELRDTLKITSMLRQLSEDVITAEEDSRAAETILRTAHNTTNSYESGIILLTPDGEIQVEAGLDAGGIHHRKNHPMETVQQAIEMGQSIFVSKNQGVLACYPLFMRSQPLGALWMHIPESRGKNFSNIQLLANQAAVSLERVNLLAESRRQAKEIKAAYDELEKSYDQTLKALMSALDARDRETEGHSMRVSRLACMLGEKIGLTGEQLKALERGALLHDIGKIGISDTILHKPGKLTDDEWKVMRMHPDIGMRIVERIPFLEESMSVVRYHHERWDGSGYPLGIKGDDIPIHARIFAVVDVFDALTSTRGYRTKSSPDEAMQYLWEHADVLFDREIVEALSQLPYADFTESSYFA